MFSNALAQFALFAAATLALAIPCSYCLAKLFNNGSAEPGLALRPIESCLKRVVGSQFSVQQTWRGYLFSAILFNLAGFFVLFLILLNQASFPWNPQQFGNLPLPLAFNAAVSFMTNTDWEAYTGETTLSYFSQMAGMAVQNFLSSATGIAVAFAVVRGFIRKENPLLGNFYADVARITAYILLPLAFVYSLFLIGQGVPQNLSPYVTATTLEGAPQILAQGPVASQVAIKMLGANGGGFFAANAAHPFENPTPLSNFIQLVSILLLPMSLVLAFGRMVGDKRQSWSLFASMTILFIALLVLCAYVERTPHPGLATMNVDQAASSVNPGGNMEGKEMRIGVFASALWTVAATATANGSMNSALDSYMPLGGLVPLFNMLVGEVIYGGIGCGLHGVLIYVLITVFIAGLMVGRTPEYLGKKIEAHEMKLTVLSLFVYPLCVLGFGVLGLLSDAGAYAITADGPHGLTQAIYAHASATANNGSAFAGFNADTTYHNVLMGLVMAIGRFGAIAIVLAIAGSFASKKTVPSSIGTFPTHGSMFVIMLTGVVVLFGGLTYFPALALGPIAEHLTLFAP